MSHTIRNRDNLRALKTSYLQDGFSLSGPILSEPELRKLSDRIDAICSGNIAFPPGNIRYYHGLPLSTPSQRMQAVWQVLSSHATDDVIRQLCLHPLIAVAVNDLLDGIGQVITSQIITKPALHGEAIPWHQDSSYWGQRRVVTCWLAIDDATPENGCMRMIPGSHRQGQLPYTPRHYGSISADLLEANGVDDSLQVHVAVPAGCASFHSPFTLHASSKNTTSHRRRAIAITYANDP